MKYFNTITRGDVTWLEMYFNTITGGDVSWLQMYSYRPLILLHEEMYLDCKCTLTDL